MMGHFDAIVAAEIKQGKCYPPVPLLGEVRCVVDVGANVGMAACLFAQRWPEANVYCYEPDPESFAKLQENTKNNQRIKAMPYGICKETGIVKLFQGKHGSVTNSIKQSKLNYDACHADVTMFAPNSLPENIDVLKIDTEGCELEILRELHSQRKLDGIALIYVEFHSALDLRKINELLESTHVLCRGNITDLHRGELTYIHIDRIPEDAHFLKIE